MISSAVPASRKRKASYSAFSQKGFIVIFAFARSTPDPSALTRALTCGSRTRLTHTSIFISFAFPIQRIRELLRSPWLCINHQITTFHPVPIQCFEGVFKPLRCQSIKQVKIHLSTAANKAISARFEGRVFYRHFTRNQAPERLYGYRRRPRYSHFKSSSYSVGREITACCSDRRPDRNRMIHSHRHFQRPPIYKRIQMRHAWTAARLSSIKMVGEVKIGCLYFANPADWSRWAYNE